MSALSAKKKLKENASLIDQKSDPVMWNLNAALIDLCDSVQGISRDMEMVFRRLDLIRNALGEDQGNTEW